MPGGRFRRRRVGLAARLAGPEVQLGLDACDQRLVGKVLVHPVQVLVAALDDAERVPRGHVLLPEVGAHEVRVNLVDVLQPHDHAVGDPGCFGADVLLLVDEPSHRLASALVGLVEHLLARVHDVVRVEWPS